MNQVYSLPLTFIILTIILVGRYFIISGVFHWIIKQSSLLPLDQGEVKKNQIRRDILWSLSSSCVFAFASLILVRSYQSGVSRIYLNISDYPIWYLPLSFVLYLFLQDTYFYWTHRLMHRMGYIHIHFAHHESRIPTAWTSFAFHPWEALIQAVLLPLLILFIPIHMGVLLLLLMVMSLFGVTNHLGYEIFPVSSNLITATHHQLHHRKLNYNFGLYFTCWDKWMGTEHS